MNSLNPVMRIEDQITEPLFIHNRDMTKEEAVKRACEVFQIVGLPLDFMRRYPFELSGGMRQRGNNCHGSVTNPNGSP